MSLRRVPLVLSLIAWIVPPAPPAHASEDEAQHILRSAFRQRYEAESLQRLEIRVTGPAGEPVARELEVATKLFEDRLYVLGRFTAPPRLRGTAFLAIENADASDYFVYLPAFRKVRRVSSYQRSDPWFETDLSFEDVERHYTSDYGIRAIREQQLDGERVHRIATTPRYSSSFAEIRFFVALADHAILRIEYRKKGRERPTKVIEARRGDMIARGGVTLPRRLLARNLDRGTQTEVIAREIQMDPDVGRRFFSTNRLEVRRKLPFLREGPPEE